MRAPVLGWAVAGLIVGLMGCGSTELVVLRCPRPIRAGLNPSPPTPSLIALPERLVVDETQAVVADALERLAELRGDYPYLPEHRFQGDLGVTSAVVSDFWLYYHEKDPRVDQWILATAKTAWPSACQVTSAGGGGERDPQFLLQAFICTAGSSQADQKIYLVLEVWEGAHLVAQRAKLIDRQSWRRELD